MSEGALDSRRLIADELRMLLDSVPARVALLDRNRRHWYVNQDYAQFRWVADRADPWTHCAGTRGRSTLR